MTKEFILNDRSIAFAGIKPFEFYVSYRDIELIYERPDVDHVHDMCEIYINISGNVSFMVENSIYPVCSGDVIITMPNEAHHCIHHSNSRQEYFWILFSADENKELFDLFLNRSKGKSNHISLYPQRKDELISLCYSLIREEKDSLSQYIDFLRLIDILRTGHINESERAVASAEISLALAIIEKNLQNNISINDIAERVHLSIATLERQFKKYIGVTPNKYLLKKKLTFAASLLANGYSVKAAADSSGFSDCSGFIIAFKRYFGLTPLKYRACLNKEIER